MKRYLSWVIPAIASLSIAVSAGAEGYFHLGFGTGGLACEFGYYDYWGEYCDDFWDPGFEMDFYTYLEPYGRWTYVSRWGGYVWVPRVAIGWRPYTCGRWIWTEYGWTWVAYEPWGWLPHHYGHWVYDVYYGWVWLPGTRWAPAWVVWHHAPGWVGWAPMPPYWQRHYYWDGHVYRPRSRYKWKYPRDGGYLSRRSWVYVSNRDFQGSDLRSVVKEKFPGGEDYRGDFEISRDGPEKRQIERAIGLEVGRVEVEEVVRRTVRGDEVKIVRPMQEVARTREAREAVERYVEPALDREHRQMLRERHEAILAQREEREWRASHSRSTKGETEGQHEKVSRSAYSTKKPGENTARHEEEAGGRAVREEVSKGPGEERREQEPERGSYQPHGGRESQEERSGSRSETKPSYERREEHREPSAPESSPRSYDPNRGRSQDQGRSRGEYSPPSRNGTQGSSRGRW